ncbi:MAG: RNB domain-containing ribonuclease [Snodgrassella sp.]|uniref:ribonuclease catalytic domain-containing protein n=1 Tax=Snodgrassella TaxID=1193515 RepID=UPI0008158CFD|nr:MULTISPECIES: RNB domain-containing ribonuclease [Snodgrassella]MCO6506938.1 RNB domain-containing ribonuclease [Snodgrassella sp.]MCO6507918.1 RNB domain-containing ribonuclease [Snodgrassella sp.]MCO6514369.1 RNB domain-containing ribonuclease [Snodgrassella sp.]MCO6518905.1 RNB domain-containing ribonuclease [Snodgrassella sp.]MCO6521206.1 RNB domain-containing ribonuclease [Snodgrassella sp.]
MGKQIFYEESGQFKVAEVVQENDATFLVNTAHGKRAKIKASHVFLVFDGDASQFLQQAADAAAGIDISLLWEAVGSEAEFTAASAATEYFGGNSGNVELAATLMALYAAPIYFYKKNKGVFKAAPEEALQLALAAIERRKQQEAQINSWIQQLLAGSLPAAIAADAKVILHAPDKQSLSYKAVIKAAEQKKTSLFTLLQSVGAVPPLPEYFLDGFLLTQFPKGAGCGDYPVPVINNLPVADTEIRAFSIDDIETSEVDDAFSVRDLPNGNKLVGIHIAAPALAITAESPLEKLIFERLSTVYYPGGKITMLPDNWIAAFSLDEGAARPAVSLYAEVNPQFEIVHCESRIESVYIDCNLRIENIEQAFQPQQMRSNAEVFAHQHEMNWLYDFAVARMQARGKYDPERLPQYDYGIKLEADNKVRISVRERGAPIDTLVSELMIFANSTWAQMLDEAGMAGLFRVQPAGRVRMSTQSEPHVGLGLKHYAWFTSPLRRATDYINQKQLISLLDETALPRFEPQEAMLFAVLRDFESAYTAYNDFQRHMEAYWSLIYIQQERLQELTARLIRDDLVRIEGLPLVSRVSGVPIDVIPKCQMKVAITGIDLEQVSVGLNYVNVLMPVAGV